MKIGNIPLSDLLNYKKWKIFARYLTLKILKTQYDEFKVPEYREQIVYRMNKCPECVIAGKCVECSCKSPALFYDKTNWCEIERWDEMVRPELWEDYKKVNGITINPYNLKELETYGEVKWKRVNN